MSTSMARDAATSRSPLDDLRSRCDFKCREKRLPICAAQRQSSTILQDNGGFSGGSGFYLFHVVDIDNSRPMDPAEESRVQCCCHSGHRGSNHVLLFADMKQHIVSLGF